MANSYIWRPNAGGKTGLVLLLPLVAAFLMLVCLPTFKLAMLAFEGGVRDALSAYFSNKANLYILYVTFRDSLIVAVLACGVGGIIAWSMYTSRSKVWRTILWGAVLAPLMMGAVVKNYSFVILLARHGPINDLLLAVGLTDERITMLFSEGAVIVGIFYAMFPFAALPLYVAFRSVNLDLVAAAESLGSTRVQAIRTIVLPLILPSMLASGVLVFVLASGFYVTPLVLGGGRSPFMAPLIARSLYEFNDIRGAALSSLILIVVALIVVAIGVALVGRDRMRRALG